MDNRNKDIVLVDKDDNIIGTEKVIVSHHKDYLKLHRAFSVFAFDDQNRLLLQKRSNDKLVFPSCWGNSCCSHPFLNDLSFTDPMLDCRQHAIKRLEYELGIKNIELEDLVFLGRVLYKADGGEVTGNIVESPVKRCEPRVLVPNETPKDFDFTKNDFREHELDYIFIVKKKLELSLNPSEVEEFRYISKEDLKTFVKENELSPWLTQIFKFFDVYDNQKLLEQAKQCH